MRLTSATAVTGGGRRTCGPGGLRVAGVVHDIEQDTAFLRGYRGAGGKIAFDAAERERVALYRAYLHLIMLD